MCGTNNEHRRKALRAWTRDSSLSFDTYLSPVRAHKPVWTNTFDDNKQRANGTGSFLSHFIQSTKKSLSGYADQLGIAISSVEGQSRIATWLESTIMCAMNSLHSLNEHVDSLSDLITSNATSVSPALCDSKDGLIVGKVSLTSLFGTFLRSYSLQVNRDFFDGLTRSMALCHPILKVTRRKTQSPNNEMSIVVA